MANVGVDQMVCKTWDDSLLGKPTGQLLSFFLRPSETYTHTPGPK